MASKLAASVRGMVLSCLYDVQQRIEFMNELFRWSSEWGLAPDALLDILRTVYPNTLSDSDKLTLLVYDYREGKRMPWEEKGAAFAGVRNGK